MTACEAMTVATVASTTSGSVAQSGPGGRRGWTALGSSRIIAPWPEVVEGERGEDDEEPGEADGRPAEVAHVGVERLGAGDRQHHRAHGDEGDERVLGDEHQRVRRRERLAGSPGWRRHGAGRAPASTANQSTITGPKTLPTTPVPERWIDEEHGQHDDGDRQHQLGEGRADHLSPSTADRTEMAGVIIAVAVEQGGPEHAHRHHRSDAVACRCRWRRSSATSARMPPSPSLSARMTSDTYFIETTSVIDQNTSEMTPKTSPRWPAPRRGRCGTRSASRRAGSCRCRRRRCRGPRAPAEASCRRRGAPADGRWPVLARRRCDRWGLRVGGSRILGRGRCRFAHGSHDVIVSRTGRETPCPWRSVSGDSRCRGLLTSCTDREW